MKTVYIEHSNPQYDKMWESMGYAIINNYRKADVICFTGGEDVNPALYAHMAHPTTYYNTYRDDKESAIFRYAHIHAIPCVGICRGAQFLNVMSGGTMYQDITNHTRDHLIKDCESQKIIEVSSTHHQMMKPSSEALLVAFSDHPHSRTYWDGDKFITVEANLGYEVVYYPYTKSLCFQPHPEFDGYPEMREYFTSLVNRLVGGRPSL